MDTDDASDKAREGYGRFEETAHHLAEAAAERAGGAASRVRRAGTGALDSLTAVLSESVRVRPAFSVLMACAAGYLLGWVSDRR